MHKACLDYDEVYSHFSKLDIVRLILVIAYGIGWPLFHLNFKVSFLNGLLEAVVYKTQPLYFKIRGRKLMIFKLNKVLFGLKKTRRALNKRINEFLV